MYYHKAYNALPNGYVALPLIRGAVSLKDFRFPEYGWAMLEASENILARFMLEGRYANLAAAQQDIVWYVVTQHTDNWPMTEVPMLGAEFYSEGRNRIHLFSTTKRSGYTPAK